MFKRYTGWLLSQCPPLGSQEPQETRSRLARKKVAPVQNNFLFRIIPMPLDVNKKPRFCGSIKTEHCIYHPCCFFRSCILIFKAFLESRFFSLTCPVTAYSFLILNSCSQSVNNVIHVYFKNKLCDSKRKQKVNVSFKKINNGIKSTSLGHLVLKMQLKHFPGKRQKTRYIFKIIVLFNKNWNIVIFYLNRLS